MFASYAHKDIKLNVKYKRPFIRYSKTKKIKKELKKEQDQIERNKAEAKAKQFYDAHHQEVEELLCQVAEGVGYYKHNLYTRLLAIFAIIDEDALYKRFIIKSYYREKTTVLSMFNRKNNMRVIFEVLFTSNTFRLFNGKYDARDQAIYEYFYSIGELTKRIVNLAKEMI